QTCALPIWTRGSVSRTWPRAFLVLKAHLPRVFLLAVSKYSAPGPVLSKIPVPAPGGRGCAGPLALRYLSAGTAAPLYRGRGDEPTVRAVGGRGGRRPAHRPVRADDGAGVLAGRHERAGGVQPVRADAAARAKLPAGVRRRGRARAAGELPVLAGVPRVPGGDRPLRAGLPGLAEWAALHGERPRGAGRHARVRQRADHGGRGAADRGADRRDHPDEPGAGADAAGVQG